jgi:protein-S-isoprenylcysteine O-methyltransferase
MVVVILPVLGNAAMFGTSQLWLLVAVGIIASIFQPNYNPFGSSLERADRGTATQIIWSIYLTQLAVVLEAAYVRFPESANWNAFTSLGLILIVGGLFLRSWAVLTLKRFFTWHIRTQEDQVVVTTGPYNYLRHPGYFGALLTYVGTAVFLHSWFSLPLCLVVLLAAFMRRMHYEEKELLERLGADYKAYCDTVRRFIPGVW